MLNGDKLIQMSQMDAASLNHHNLVDLRLVLIDTSLPLAQRLEQFVEQMGNPYVFLCDKTTVQVTFQTGAKTLEGSLETYFTQLLQESPADGEQ